jgi:hypothetical protein
MIASAEEILFRCSGLGYLMTDPQGKAPAEKLVEANERLKKYTLDYAAMLNKGTQTAMNKHQQILKLNTEILMLQAAANDSEHLSATCRKILIRIYAEQVKGRREELKNKYLTKGNARENDSITLLSRVKRIPYKKNTERRKNAFITGEWDLHNLDEKGNIIETVDTKSSWSYITFLESQEKELNKIYDYQGQGYMDLTGAKQHTVAYCLVNGTIKHIRDQVRRIQWNHGILDGSVSEDVDYLKEIAQMERNHIFDIDSFMKEVRKNDTNYTPANDVFYSKGDDSFHWEFDVPKEERVHTKTFLRDEDKIKAYKDQIKVCRAYMQKRFFKTI